MGGCPKDMIRVAYHDRPTMPFVYSLERVFNDVRTHLPEDISPVVVTGPYANRGLSSRLRNSLHARRVKADVHHVTGDTHYLTYFLARSQTILTVHDCVSLRRLRGLRRFLLWFLWYWLPAHKVSVITTVSQAMKNELVATLGCRPSKVRVVHNPVSPVFKPSPKPFNQARPTVLQVGTAPNKNLSRVAEALRGTSGRFVTLGPLSTAQQTSIGMLGIEHINIRSTTEDGLLGLYQEADIVVLASTYEGFGLPIVEAQAVGRPVVTGNVHSMPEVAGDAACLVDPFDVTSIREGILRVLTESAYRGDLVERGFKNAQRFKVQRITNEYCAIYREIAWRAGPAGTGSPG